jgi:hypothetical protein
MWSFHAAVGSRSSSRVQNATASQSRSTSGSPKTWRAHPSVGYARPDQLIAPSRKAVIWISIASFGRARPTRSPSRSCSSSGSGSPVVARRAARSSFIARNRSTTHGGDHSSTSSDADSIIARRACWSK